MSDPQSAAPDFESMMRTHGPLIYTLAVRLSGNPADGQDLAQETFVNAYKNLSRFRGDSNIRTWLYRICINLWKNRVRYEKRRFFWQHVSVDKEDEQGPLQQLAAPDRPAGSALEAADRTALVNHALDQLSVQDRGIVVLRDMEDKSYEEISDLLGVPVGTVKSRLARGRERLRQCLAAVLRETP